MASVRKTEYGTWKVSWRTDSGQKGRTFKTRAEAKTFAASIEAAANHAQADILTFEAVLKQYRDTVTQKKKAVKQEELRINRLLQRPIVKKTIGSITTKDINRHFEERAQERTARSGSGLVSPATILKERGLMSAVFNWAIKQGYISESPVKGSDKPEEPPHRERVATDEEIEAIKIAAGWDGTSVPETETQLVSAAFVFACRCGMRSGEILRIEESWVDGRVVHLPKEATKTNARRDVALSSEALRILNLVRGMGESPRIFGRLDDRTRDVLWRKIRDRAGLGPVLDSEGRQIREGLNFHDSRATFCTWAASPDPKTGAPRLDVLALARQTGHKDLRMLQRYYRESAAEIAKRLG